MQVWQEEVLVLQVEDEGAVEAEVEEAVVGHKLIEIKMLA